MYATKARVCWIINYFNIQILFAPIAESENFTFSLYFQLCILISIKKGINLFKLSICTIVCDSAKELKVQLTPDSLCKEMFEWTVTVVEK